MFKYPSIIYKENTSDSTKLDTEIYLIPKEKFSLGLDFDLSHLIYKILSICRLINNK